MFVLGTAGHVDHGKSTLIRRLTGIDPDRLAEEKARGLTIDLGFAWMTLPSGREVGIVDVPGHERFVHNMLAGAGQVDAVVFVVDANEGWRTQSEEHLAILDLLGARGGVVALTKVDVARDADATAVAVRDRLRGTVLDGAPVVPVSAVTGVGVDALLAAIDATLNAVPEPPDTGRPRLFVDRSFSIKGSGTVVTGTLTGGRLRDGQDVVLLPRGLRARVRGMQTHRSAVAEAAPTSRVALNLGGVERDAVRRGDVVAHAGRWLATTTLDVELRAVRALEHPVRSRGAYLLYAGTAEVPAKLRLVDADALEAGETAFARLRLDEPVVAAPGDRVVIRDTGRRATVAGGRVLDAHPPGRADPSRLRARAGAEPKDYGDLAVAERGVVAAADLEALSGVAVAPASVRLPSFFVSGAWLGERAAALEDALRRFHEERPLERGIPRDAARVAAGVDDPRLFDELLAALPERLAADGPLVRLAGHRVRLDPEQERARAALLAAAEGFSPPGLADLAGRFGGALVKALIESGELVRVSGDIAFARDSYDAAKRRIADAIGAEGGLTAARIKDLLGTTRKYAIPLLEHLDASGFTRRDGDVRLLRP